MKVGLNQLFPRNLGKRDCNVWVRFRLSADFKIEKGDFRGD